MLGNIVKVYANPSKLCSKMDKFDSFIRTSVMSRDFISRLIRMIIIPNQAEHLLKACFWCLSQYTNEIQLIRYVEENGKDIELPFTETVQDIVYNRDYLSAVVVYDETGRACASAYDTFTGDGEIDGFSGDNSAGNLEENNPVL